MHHPHDVITRRVLNLENQMVALIGRSSHLGSTQAAQFCAALIMLTAKAFSFVENIVIHQHVKQPKVRIHSFTNYTSKLTAHTKIGSFGASSKRPF